MAKDLYTSEKTVKTPFIHLDGSTGNFEFRGKSIPEHAVNFYKPLTDWIENYANNPAPKTYFKFQLDYFNTSSSKCIITLMKKLDSITEKGKGEVLIDWLYDEDDEDIQEVGEVYKSILKSKVNLIPFHRP